MFSYKNYGKATKYYYDIEFPPGQIVNDVPGYINDPEIIRVFSEEVEQKRRVTFAVAYKIIFKNWDNSELSAKYYPVGTVLNPPTPTRPPDEQYTYVFDGWDPELVPVTADATYTATYTAVSTEYVYAFIPPVVTLIKAPHSFEDSTVTIL